MQNTGRAIFYKNMGETLHLLLALMRRSKGEGERGASKKGRGYTEYWGSQKDLRNRESEYQSQVSSVTLFVDLLCLSKPLVKFAVNTTGLVEFVCVCVCFNVFVCELSKGNGPMFRVEWNGKDKIWNDQTVTKLNPFCNGKNSEAGETMRK